MSSHRNGSSCQAGVTAGARAAIAGRQIAQPVGQPLSFPMGVRYLATTKQGPINNTNVPPVRVRTKHSAAARPRPLATTATPDQLTTADYQRVTARNRQLVEIVRTTRTDSTTLLAAKDALIASKDAEISQLTAAHTAARLRMTNDHDVTKAKYNRLKTKYTQIAASRSQLYSHSLDLQNKLHHARTWSGWYRRPTGKTPPPPEATPDDGADLFLVGI